MDFQVHGTNYTIKNITDIETPRLCVFDKYVDDNMNRMQDLLQHIDKSLTLSQLCPHVKTHKSSYIAQKMLKNSIQFFKCSMNEIDMLLDAGAERVFIAYPLLHQQAEKISLLISKYPHVQFYIQLDCMEHAEIVCRFTEINWHYFIDVNVGMDRTGVSPEQALAIYKKLQIFQDRLHFSGIHAYDGHVHQIDEHERKRTSQESMTRLLNCVSEFNKVNISVEQIITSGTPGFLFDAEILSQVTLNSKLYYSPGTWIYSDSFTEQAMPDSFNIAAMILAQVIDLPTAETATLNLGHKRWAVDMGPVEFTSLPGAQVESWSEEHTVIRLPKNKVVHIADYVLIAPRHVCSTVNLWEFAALIDHDGFFSQKLLIDARNR